MKKYKVIGIMSGTSLDGVDLAYCELTFSNEWTYKIIHTETIAYDKTWTLRLSELNYQLPAIVAKTNVFYGHYLGKLVNDMIKRNDLKVDLISSHGHTLYHQPEQGFTFQIGCGAAIYSECNIPVVCDFRSLDVALGGQGAPLVSYTDKLLFKEYTYCLNLGGIANISCEVNGKRIAFDICPVNMILNYIANALLKEYDEDGLLARSGNVNEELLTVLNQISYYKNPHPKSLGKEWVDKNIKPIIKMSNISYPDKLCTYSEHIALQINQALERLPKENVKQSILVTGGGTYNNYLVERLKKHIAPTSGLVVIPDKELIKYKEALAFCLLGVLRVRNEVNCLSSSTGSRADNVGGALYGVWKG